MPLTLPNLDDRRYADLVEEARGLLIANAPALTNHNPSDPIITLIELFAYFTEILLFRANYVTDANRVKFLRLLNGPDWEAPATREALEAEIRNTVSTLRRTDRAVTTADFEFLARAADARVARARCIPVRNLDLEDPTLRTEDRPGHVSVVIVAVDGAPPPADLLAAVAEYLEPRRLLTTRVHVAAPRFVPVRARVTLRLLPDALEDATRTRVVDALTDYLDPTLGGDGNGWPFGRDVYISEIYRLLDGLEGVDYAQPSRDPGSGDPLEELVVPPAYADRLVRNTAGALISVALDPDELVAAQIDPADIDIETPLHA